MNDKTFSTKCTSYRQYNGMKYKINRELTNKEVDFEVGKMFEITLENNIIIHAFEDELLNKTT